MNKRLAIIGAGPSGLVMLRQARLRLPDWELVCFEKGSRAVGCWGFPHNGFVSTSTKYTTQFSCFRKWTCDADSASRPSMADFFRDGEYGQYLEDFVESFDLGRFVKLRHEIVSLREVNGDWVLEVKLPSGDITAETFTHVAICTGLVAEAKSAGGEIPSMTASGDLPDGKCIVVMGGGESGADIAHRLADPRLNNRVYLSLRSGIRVSPRYHPIRGVPSDFLRNRLMLSIDRGLRNAIGERFVRFRIRHRRLLERMTGNYEAETEHDRARAFWDHALTSRAKGSLFDIFHTKSDGFLDDVAASRISIVGSPADASLKNYHNFLGGGVTELNPDLVCPAVGYRSKLAALSAGKIRVEDFFLGCIHKEHENLFLLGFSRPVIGNIPTISEMQAKYISRILSGQCARPLDLEKQHSRERAEVARNFPELDRESIHPVEMIPFCDRLAGLMGTLPTPRALKSWRLWIRVMLAPVSTEHYVDEDFSAEIIRTRKIHTPATITFLLLLVKIFQPFLLFMCGRFRPRQLASPHPCSK